MRHPLLKTILMASATMLSQAALAQFAVVRHTPESGHADTYNYVDRITVAKAPREIVLDVTNSSEYELSSSTTDSIVVVGETSSLYGKIPGNKYLMLRGLTDISATRVTFNIPLIAKGTYDIYAVFAPDTYYKNAEEGQNLPTRFQTYMSSRRENGTMTSSIRLQNPVDDTSYFYTSMDALFDTVCLAKDYAIAGEPVEYPDAKIELYSVITNSLKKTYTSRMSIASIILRAHDDVDGSFISLEEGERTETWGKNSISQVDLFDRPEVKVNVLSNSITNTALQVESNYDGVGGSVKVELPITNRTDPPVAFTVMPQKESEFIRMPVLMLPGVKYAVTPQKFGATVDTLTTTDAPCECVSVSDAVVLPTGETRLEGKITGLKTFREQALEQAKTTGLGEQATKYEYGFVSTYDYHSTFGNAAIAMSCGEFDLNTVDDTLAFRVDLDYGYGEDRKYAVYIAHAQSFYSGSYEPERSAAVSEVKTYHSMSRDEYEEVIAPQMVKSKVKDADGCNLFSELLALTELDVQMEKYRDYDYEDRVGNIADDWVDTKYIWTSSSYNWKCRIPSTRNQGFTIFAETDSVFRANGITDVASLKAYLQAHAAYGSQTSYGDDYTSEDNAVNQFVAYHILGVGLKPNMLTTRGNEYGMNSYVLKQLVESGTLDSSYSRNTWEYWESIGKYRRPVKVTQARQDGQIGYYLNRYVPYNTSTYLEIQSDPGKIEGVNVLTDQVMEGMNGYVYPINDLLLWTADVPNKVLNERMRYDWCTLLPEMNSNHIRQNRSEYRWFIPDNFCDNVTLNSDANLIYFPNQEYMGSISSWSNMQLDEFNVMGAYDMTLKLPAVPSSGTYELRMGFNMNNYRGQALISVGTDPDNLTDGQEFDFTSLGNQAYLDTWKPDYQLNDEEDIAANDAALRELGFMKGPKYIYFSNGTGRDGLFCCRRIVYKGTFEAGKTYYMRLKNTSEKPDYTMMHLDYIEIVPQSVIDAGEDIW